MEYAPNREEPMSHMRGFTKLYDISVQLGAGSIDYPGDPPFHREQTWSIDEHSAYSLSTITMSVHSGTHLDSPAHFIPHGKSIDRYAVEEFVLSARVVNIENPSIIDLPELEECSLVHGEAILFRTENSRQGRCRSGVFSDYYVHLSARAAQYCVDAGVPLIGIDYISVDRADDEDYPVHRVILGSGRLILEGIDLETVPTGRYVLVCVPLNIKDAEASPVRALLMA